MYYYYYPSSEFSEWNFLVVSAYANHTFISISTRLSLRHPGAFMLEDGARFCYRNIMKSIDSRINWK